MNVYDRIKHVAMNLILIAFLAHCIRQGIEVYPKLGNTIATVGTITRLDVG